MSEIPFGYRLCFAVVFACGVGAQPTPSSAIAVTVDASKTGAPIARYIYGQFIEHLSDTINKGLWAEMLDDRKFFYEVNSNTEEPKPPAGMTTGRARRLNRWRPIGPDQFVAMDRVHPYVGDQTPVVRLDATAAHGIQQAGLLLRQGGNYTGRIVLAGDAGAKVTVSLVWGPNPADRQTVTIGRLGSAYGKFPLKFTAGAASTSGRIEIAGTGTGSFHIGAVSLMPGDNVQGFRREVVALLKQLDSGFYRFPGGNFLSNHDWQDAIGDPDQRPPTWDYHWSALQPNDVGTDEFMVLCGLLGVDPYITVNAGFGEPRSAADQVEYCNGPVDTPFGKLRAANGHPAPYKVKFWNVGNEPYGWWQLGHMALNQYAIKHNLFAQAMRRKDPGITVIASGAMPDEMTVTTNSRRVTGKVLTEFGSDADWTGGLLAHSWGFFDALSEHWYCHSGTRFDLETGQHGTLGTRAGFVPVEESLVDWARRPANRVRSKAENWDEYVKRFPAIKEKGIYVSIDEWAYDSIRPSLKLNLSLAWAMHEMFRHTDFIKMAAYTFATSCVSSNDTDAVLNPTGLLFQLYHDHFGTIPVDVAGNSPQPAPKWPVGGDQPKINAGSATYPLDVAAAWSADRKTFTVAIVNPTESAQTLDFTFQGVAFRGKGTLRLMTAPDLNATNLAGEKPGLEIKSSAVAGALKSVTVPAISIGIYELAAQ